MNNKKFNWKSFISFTLFISFFIIVITGVALYLAPPGRVAKWVNWEFMGFTKDQWQAQHTLFTLLFLLTSVFHIFSMNWKVFLSYLKKKATAKRQGKIKELIVGFILVTVVFLGTHFKLLPFQGVMDFGEHLTESWERKEQRAPVPHTESLSINEVSAQLLDISPGEIVEKLINNQIRVKSTGQTLKQIGEDNNLSPFELYKMISFGVKKKTKAVDSLREGSGIGRKTLEEVGEILGRPVDELVSILQEKGILAAPGEAIKEIAARAKRTPFEIVGFFK